MPVMSPLHHHWDNALADTVPVVGCHCTFCGLRPALQAHAPRHKRNGRAVSTSILGLPPQRSVLEVLYAFPENSMQSSSISSAGTLVEAQRLLPSHRRIVVSMPEAEQYVPISAAYLPLREPQPPPYSAYDIGLTYNETPPNNYDILGPYPNPYHSIYLSPLSDQRM